MHFEMQKIFWDVFKDYIRTWGDPLLQRVQSFWTHPEGDRDLLEEADFDDYLLPSTLHDYVPADILPNDETIKDIDPDFQLDPLAYPSSRRLSRTCLTCGHLEQLPVPTDTQTIADISNITHTYESAIAVMPLALTAYLTYSSRHRFKRLFNAKMKKGFEKARHQVSAKFGRSERMTSVYV